MNQIKKFFLVYDSLPWTRSQDGKWTMLTTETWRALNYGVCENLRNAQHSVHLTALRRGLALSLLFNVILLAVLLVSIGGK